MQYFLIYVLTLHKYSDIIMSSRKTRNKIKKPVAELPTKRQAPNKKKKGAYIITYAGKGVNHEQRSIRDIKRDKKRL